MLPFDKTAKAYKKLKCPEGVYDPTTIPWKRNKYFVLCSERSIGKTTNILLYGMCMREEDGKTQLQYIRQHEDMLTPKNLNNLFATIEAFGYVEKVTKGKWKDLYYYSRGWYYCNKDENGKIVEKDTAPFMVCLGLNRNEYYKSSYNAPFGNFIIYDEFVSRYAISQDEFIMFCDVTKTIIRGRSEPVIVMLGNTLDRYNMYFSEMELLGITTSMPLGEHTETATAKGTPIYVEFPTGGKTHHKLEINRLFYGFKNKKLGAITGDDWAIVPMQHIDSHDDEREILFKNIYVLYEGNVLQLEFAYSPSYGSHVLAHMAKAPHDDSRIYSADLMIDSRYRYKFGYDDIDKLIWTLYERKKFYYASNTVGVLIDKYVDTCKQQRRLY